MRRLLLFGSLLLIAAAAPPTVEITGTEVLNPRVARSAAGLPRADTADLAAWGAGAAARIVAAYATRGYSYARAWSKVGPDGSVLIDVDEGRMSGIVFVGASPDQAILFRVDVALPDDVFHLPTLEHGLDEIKTKYNLVSVDWAVVDREELIPNRLDQPVPLRSLRVNIARENQYGWRIAAELDPTFGLVPRGGYTHSSLLMDGDKLGVSLAVGVPWRRYLLDAEPKFTWVHGELLAAYTTVPFADGRLSASYEAAGAVSRFDRVDLGLATYFAARWSTYLNLQVHLVRQLLVLSFGFGVGDTHVFRAEPVVSTPPVADTSPPERTRFRYLFRVLADLDLDPDASLVGRKRDFRLQAVFALPQSGGSMLDLLLTGRYVFTFGYHDLLLKVRGVYLLGDVLFWDEQTLAGEFQRVFFGDRYWIHQAAQLELAVRFGVYDDKVKLGLFHDFSVFADRTRPGHPAAWANGFGPSIHFLIFDQFQLDLYYGFGFAPAGFDHNFSLALETTF